MMLLSQQQVPSSTQRKSTQKAPHKKSAGSQAHQSQESSGLGNKTRGAFNLMVTNKVDSTLKPVPQFSSMAPQGAMMNNKQVATNTIGGNGRLSGQNIHHSQVQSANQKRVQSTAPRLFSYKPQINDIGKSPFLQPIISQKQLKQPLQVGLMPGLGQHGKQVMTSMLKHQQQPPIQATAAPAMIKQQAQALVNSRLTKPLALQGQSNSANQQLTVLPAPLPKFLAKKQEAVPQYPINAHQPHPSTFPLAPSALENIILQQQNSQSLVLASSSMNQSPRQSAQIQLLGTQIQNNASPKADSAQKFSQQSCFPSASVSHQNQHPGSGSSYQRAISPTSNGCKGNAVGTGLVDSQVQSGILADQLSQKLPQGIKQSVTGLVTVADRNSPLQTHQQQQQSASLQDRQGLTTSGFTQTLQTSLVQQKQQSNGQPRGNGKTNSPIVSYLMHLHQNSNSHKWHKNELMKLQRQQQNLQPTNQSTLHRSQSNLVVQDRDKRGDPLFSQSRIRELMSNDTQNQGYYDSVNQQNANQLQTSQDCAESPDRRKHDLGGNSHHFMLVDNQNDASNYGSMNGRPASMVKLGQSPSNQALANNNNILYISQKQQLQHLQQQASQIGPDFHMNKPGKQIIRHQNPDPRLSGSNQQDYKHQMAQIINVYNQQVLSQNQHQQHQTASASNYTTLEQFGKSPPRNFDQYMQQYAYDDDQGIDERYDGYQSGDSCGEDAFYAEPDEFTSPRAAKPKPLDQTFVPEKGKKYFSVTIGYPAMRRVLRSKGWIEVKCYKKLQQIAGYLSSPGQKGGGGNLGLESTMNRQFDNNIDLKFVLSAQDANHQNLKPNCLINQNRGEGNLTCKSGLKESLLRSYQHMANWYPMEHCDPKGVGPEAFFPRSHTINSSEALQEFQRDFVITEAENYLRKYLKKLNDFKEKAGRQTARSALGRIQTPQNPNRSSSKARNSSKKHHPPPAPQNPSNSNTQTTPQKKDTENLPYEDCQSEIKTPLQNATQKILAKPYNFQDLGFLKEKLLICCNILRKRLKCIDDDLDKKKGIRNDRITVGTILIEERSFLLRNPKTISQAYLKYVQKEEWFQKAVHRFPQFKKDKSLPNHVQQTSMCDKVEQTCEELLEQLKEKYPQTDMNGLSNLWIVKPGGLSRGRKIRLFKDFQKILEYAEVDTAQQLSAAAGLASSSNPSGPNTQYYMNHVKPAGDDQVAYTKKTWVIQKYIENPMLIMNRKFDIRVWVVIPTWNPLRIYFFNECYFRFSCNDYDPRCPQNLFAHLTNNSVVKKCIERPDNAKMLKKIPGNMWSLDQFKEYLGVKSLETGKSTRKLVREVNSSHSGVRPKTAISSQINGIDNHQQNDTADGAELLKTPEQTKTQLLGEGDTENRSEYLEAGAKIWENEWCPQIKEIIVQTILSAWDKIEWRKGGIGVYGFDLFPDVKGKLWLLEVNKCPTMEYSTQVTRRLVPMFLEQMTELIVEKRKGDHPVVGNLQRIFSVPKLRDLSQFQQSQKQMVVEAKGIDQINNNNYLSALHRNKRQAHSNPPTHHKSNQKNNNK